MRTAFGWLALLLFFVSLLVHVAAVLGVDVRERLPLILLLHVAIFVVFVPAVLAMRKWKSGSFRSLLAGLPFWARAFTIALFAYVIINFSVLYASMSDGHVAEKDHRFVLEQGSRFVRELTAEEYHSRRAQELRLFSGHWLVFYFISFAVLVLHEGVPERRDPMRRTSHVQYE